MFDINEFINKFKLTGVSEKELWNLRVDMVPLIILKYHGKLYVTTNVKLFSNMLSDIRRMYEHQCNICQRMSALPYCKNGCDKTHDQFLPFPYNRGLRDNRDFLNETDPYISRESLLEKLENSCRIEKYPEVTFGMVLLTKKFQRFLVLECNHFSEYKFHK